MDDMDFMTVYLDGFYDGEKKWKEKIKKELLKKEEQLKKLEEGLTGRKTNFVNRNMLTAQIIMLTDLLKGNQNV